MIARACPGKSEVRIDSDEQLGCWLHFEDCVRAKEMLAVDRDVLAARRELLPVVLNVVVGIRIDYSIQNNVVRIADAAAEIMDWNDADADDVAVEFASPWQR